MPSPLDDLPVHQAAAPLPKPATSDTHFNDGYYFAFYAPGVHVFAGLRLHPNTNVMDGYGGAVVGGVQRNVRVSRALRPQSYPFRVGPLALEIVEPMRRQRVTLDDNESGVAFDVTFSAVAPAFDETPHVQYRHGRLHNHVLRYAQVSRAHGSVTFDGETRAVDGWHAARDHSWGIRSTMGPHVPSKGIGPGSDPDRRALRLWVPFEVDGHSGFFHTHEDAAGHTLDFEGRIDFADGSPRALARVTHALEYDDRLTGGTFALTDEDATTREYRFAVACEPAHQGFGYTRGWSDGGQPGVYRGEYASEHERFDVTRSGAAPSHVPPRQLEDEFARGQALAGAEILENLVPRVQWRADDAEAVIALVRPLLANPPSGGRDEHLRALAEAQRGGTRAMDVALALLERELDHLKAARALR